MLPWLTQEINVLGVMPDNNEVNFKRLHRQSAVIIACMFHCSDRDPRWILGIPLTVPGLSQNGLSQNGLSQNGYIHIYI